MQIMNLLTKQLSSAYYYTCISDIQMVKSVICSPYSDISKFCVCVCVCVCVCMCAVYGYLRVPHHGWGEGGGAKETTSY